MNRMKAALPILLFAALACGRNSKTIQRGQQQYDVVQEGQASGATSTLSAPGEAPPPQMTNTAVDTTTNFTLPGGAPGTTTNSAGGTIAGTLPPPYSAPVYQPPVKRQPRQNSAEMPTPAPMTSSTSTAPSTNGPPTTDTVAAPPTQKADESWREGKSENKDAKKKEEPPPPPPPSTDTTATGTQGW